MIHFVNFMIFNMAACRKLKCLEKQDQRGRILKVQRRRAEEVGESVCIGVGKLWSDRVTEKRGEAVE